METVNRKELKKEEIEFFGIEESKPHTFCETPDEKCTMNYCDENGCQNRKRELVEPENMIETKQETLEEATERLIKLSRQDGFYEGAKWQQQKMYSEEEVTQLLIKFNQEIQEVEDVREWFEQFKKK